MDFSYFAYDERVRRSAMRDGKKKIAGKHVAQRLRGILYERNFCCRIFYELLVIN